MAIPTAAAAAASNANFRSTYQVAALPIPLEVFRLAPADSPIMVKLDAYADALKTFRAVESDLDGIELAVAERTAALTAAGTAGTKVAAKWSTAEFSPEYLEARTAKLRGDLARASRETHTAVRDLLATAAADTDFMSAIEKMATEHAERAAELDRQATVAAQEASYAAAAWLRLDRAGATGGKLAGMDGWSMEHSRDIVSGAFNTMQSRVRARRAAAAAAKPITPNRFVR